MKITVTYKTSVQVGPDDWNVYTEVVHLDENDTLKSVHEKLTKGFGEHSNKKFDGEIHFDCWEAKKP